MLLRLSFFRKYIFALSILLGLKILGADLLSIPYYKTVAESWRDNRYGIDNLYKDWLNLRNCQANSVACMNGLGAGFASIDLDLKIKHSSEVLLSSEKVIKNLGQFIIFESTEAVVNLQASKSVVFKRMQERKKNAIAVGKTIKWTARDIEEIKVFISQKLANNPLYGALFTATFLDEYKKTSDPFGSVVPKDLWRRLFGMSEEKNMKMGITASSVAGKFRVLKVDLESPAFWAGIRFWDEVLEVNKIPIDTLKGKDMGSLLNQDIVSFKILRAGTTLQIDVENKESIEKKVSFSLIQWKNRNVLRIDLRTFIAEFNLCRSISQTIESYKSRYELAGLILDLRNNGGGAINFGQCLSSIFLKENQVFLKEISLIDPAQNFTYLTFPTSAMVANGLVRQSEIPMAVIVNGKSASCSEAMAGALRDYERAWIVGQLTYGKGSVSGSSQWPQSNQFLEYKTTGLFYQPNTTTNELVGVIPDFIVPSRHNGTDDEDFYIRNQDENPELPFKRNEAVVPPRLNKAKEIETCVDKNDLAVRANQSFGSAAPVDNQLFYALEVLRCDK